MAAERILSLTDNLMRKAPQCIRGVCVRENSIMSEWLENSCDRDHLCHFVVREGYKAEKVAKEVTKNLHSVAEGTLLNKQERTP